MRASKLVILIVFLLSSGDLLSADNQYDLCLPYADSQNKARWSCREAKPTWQALAASGVSPLEINLPGTKNDKSTEKKLLILSPKVSEAYEESTRQILADLSSMNKKMKLILFNYQREELGNTLAKSALSLAEQEMFDMVVSMGSETTRYLTEARYKQMNVVTVCSKDPIRQQLFGRTGKVRMENIAYTSLDINVDVQVEYIKERFLKGLERIIVIYDLANISAIQTQVEPLQEFLANSTDIEYQGLGVDLANGYRDLPELDKQERLENQLFSKMKGFTQDKDVNSVFLITGSTELFNLISEINQYGGGVPIISVTPSHVKAGDKSVFVSLGISFKNNAKLAAAYIEKVLYEGVRPVDLDIGVVATPDISINFRHAPAGIQVPFQFFENAAYIYDREGEVVRFDGKTIRRVD